MVMNVKLSSLASTFFWCIFTGVIGIGIGLGAAIPPLNYIATPFVCPGGTMTNTQQGYTVSPVESVTTVSLYCVNAAGSETEVGMFPTVLYSGVIYGVIVFLVVFLIQVIAANRGGASGADTSTEAAVMNRVIEARARNAGMQQQAVLRSLQPSGGDPKARLEKLKQMLSSGLITQSEFDQKKKEILAEM